MGTRLLCACGCGRWTRRRNSEGQPWCEATRKPCAVHKGAVLQQKNLDRKMADLEGQLSRLLQENRRVVEDNRRLLLENHRVVEDNRRLLQDASRLTEQNRRLSQDVGRLSLDENGGPGARDLVLDSEGGHLAQEVNLLRARLHLMEDSVDWYRCARMAGLPVPSELGKRLRREWPSESPVKRSRG